MCSGNHKGVIGFSMLYSSINWWNVFWRTTFFRSQYTLLVEASKNWISDCSQTTRLLSKQSRYITDTQCKPRTRSMSSSYDSGCAHETFWFLLALIPKFYCENGIFVILSIFLLFSFSGGESQLICFLDNSRVGFQFVYDMKCFTDYKYERLLGLRGGIEC